MFLNFRKFFAAAAICSLLAPSGAALADQITAASVKPNDPISLEQSLDAVSSLVIGGTSPSGTVFLSATVSENLADNQTDTLTLEAEVKKTETAFDFLATSAYETDVTLTGATSQTAVIKITGLNEGNYHWQMRLKNKSNTSLVSNWVSFGGNADLPLPANTDFRVDFPPAAPGGVKAKAVGSTNTLISWTNSSDADLSGVQVWRSQDSALAGVQVASLSATDVSYSDSGLTPGTLYFYRVRSVDAVGNFSAFSSDQAAAVTDVVLDDQSSPNGGTVTKTGLWTLGGSDSSVSVSQANSGASITYTPNVPTTAVYEVFVSWMTSPDGAVGQQATDAKYTVTAGGSPTIIFIDQSKHSDQLTAGQANEGSGFRTLGIYTFTGGGLNSIRLDASTTGYVVADQSKFVYLKPVAPTDLVAKDHPNDNGGTIDLVWTASSSTSTKVYNIYRSTTSGSYDFTKAYGTSTGTSFTDIAATTGSVYFYVVRSSDRTAESVNSNETSTTSSDNLAPKVPTFTSVEVGDGFVILNWNKVEDATQYEIRYRDPATEAGFHTASITGDMASAKITDLSNDVEHEFGIAARDSAGNQSGFTTVKATPTGPAKPAIPAVSVTTAGKITKRPAAQASAQTAPAETTQPSQEEGKIKAAETAQTKRQRAAATVAILVVAVAAGVAGYYGYDWWLRQTAQSSKSKSKNGRW